MDGRLLVFSIYLSNRRAADVAHNRDGGDIQNDRMLERLSDALYLPFKRQSAAACHGLILLPRAILQPMERIDGGYHHRLRADGRFI